MGLWFYYDEGVFMIVNHVCVGPLNTNCYFAMKEGRDDVVIVDPGADTDRIVEFLQKWQRRPAAILLTHGHFDHIGAAEDLRLRYRIPIYAFEGEADVLGDESKNLCGMIRKHIVLRANRLERDMAKIKAGGMTFQVIHTPGHTKGSCCYYCEEDNVLFSGDTLFRGSYGRIDFPTGSARDIIRSISGILLALPEETMVYPGHGEETDILYEKSHNPCSF